MILKKIVLKVFPLGTNRRALVSRIYRKFIGKKNCDNIDGQFQDGKKSFDRNKETILIVSHISSATGAPLLGLNIGKSLSKNFNVINYIMRKSDIHDSFFDDAFLVAEEVFGRLDLSVKIIDELNKRYSLKTVICNSIVTYPILSIARDLKIPTLSLIHEFAGYVVPGSVMRDTLVAADRVIVPAQIVENSILDHLRTVEIISNRPKNIFVRPQGKLPFIPKTYGESDGVSEVLKKIGLDDKNGCKIIVGAGSIDIRKGVDLFISIARYVKVNYKCDCKFVWVGDGLNSSDYTYSFWLEREIKLFNLESDFVFLQHQQSLDAIFSIADIYCLTSRMDPFPNIGIDALEFNLPIACFSDASGTVEFLEKYDADYIVADYLDTNQLGINIANYLTENGKKTDVNARLVKEYLGFDEYISFLIEKINECVEYHAENLEISKKLEKSDLFDNEYIGLSETKSASVYFYVLAHRKTLHRLTSNPCPGFSNYKWLLDNGDDCKTTVPLYEALERGVSSTHCCYRLPVKAEQSTGMKIAVHLHLYYVDLAEEFNEYFQKLSFEYDLYITVVDEASINFVEEKFMTSGANKLKVLVVENVGRDVAPMLFDLRSDILDGNYDVIGHFHSKKTINAEGGLGDRWRKFLLNNLIGEEKVDAQSIIGLFNDDSIGLVFAEDKTYIDIGENREYMDSLCQIMELDKINETPIYPLGNMFWARIDAIKDMYNLSKEVVIEKEPLPIDGSYMHALERITPALVEKNGYNYVTVYKDGTSW